MSNPILLKVTRVKRRPLYSAVLGRRKNLLIPASEDHLTWVIKEKSLAKKTIEDVLLHFGDNLGETRRRYRHFVKQGVDQGKRPAFQGGGLVRSSGREKAGLLGRKGGDRDLSDQRVLGSEDFVVEILKAANEFEEKRIIKSTPIAQG